VLYEQDPVVFTTSHNVHAIHWELKSSNNFVVIFSEQTTKRQIFDSTLTSNTATPIMEQTKPLDQLELDISGPGTENSLFFVLVEENIFQKFSSLDANPTVDHQHYFSNMRAVNDKAKTIRLTPLTYTEYTLITTNMDLVIIYNWADNEFVRFVNAGYNLIGQIAIFPDQRHIAISNKDTIT
jgi:hypothetical protein